ncbi:autotransporter assembly complex protein TamA [Oharaeibacter diazotrophicus]|uniref:Translocation and assembly module TamA n=1 Tax=Oharaeibacter diazotrophicus TaxID=1920512 RepID=A0A4V3CV87_9HYPH|nr:autotransporter assembly complex family protein [Oharaeibacter diazotrophicus]TDP81548.1 translocation and assembly module TamA [Oharaeibacter diazotrophicus]BBE73786.1 translocation and assembly module TamA precursor [Pleomorphomonas sp. SM30]GLS75577.1 membrane protein [Oharaeibacter diazotrophicus]
MGQGRNDRARGLSAGVAALAVCLGATTAAGPARAFELFGVHLFGEKAPDPEASPDAQPYAIDVSVDTGDDDLATRIRDASALYADRDDTPPPSTAAFLSRVSAEYARLVGALYAEGYYGGAVTITVDGRDPATIEPDAVLPKPVKVAVSVSTGPRFTFGKVAIDGRAPPRPDLADRKTPTPESLGLVPGATARSTAVLGSERVLVDEWRRQGFPKAEIAKRDAVADHPSSTLDVGIDVKSGPAAVYGPVTASGTERMDPAFTAWMTGLKPGARYDPRDLERAAANLRRLQVFASQRLVEADAVGPDGTLPIDVKVAERLPRVFGAGGSFSTTEGAGVEGYWEHRNLFGEAERLRFEGRVAGIASTDPTDFSYFLGTSFVKPGILTPWTDLTAAVNGEREVLDAYTQNTVRGRVGLAHAFFEGLKGEVAANLEAVRIEDAAVEDDFLIASLPASLTWDTRDDALEPTEGFTLTGKLEPFHEFSYGNTGAVTELEGTTYLALDADARFVLAGRAAVGSIAGVPQDEFPASRMFFVGGGGSVRGYDYRNVGPRDATGDPIGGRSYVEASVELRAKVTDTIGVVPFLDAGQAFASSLPDFSEDLALGAGIGLRYYTGLGAIRVDGAVPLNPGPGDPAFAVYVGLGQSF